MSDNKKMVFSHKKRNKPCSQFLQHGVVDNEGKRLVSAIWHRGITLPGKTRFKFS